jgi:tripartite-type tricarboxylate transporter receptor subunit TctC
VRFIVPFPPGGGTDTVARAISQRLADSLGQQVVIDNRSGANAIIGTELGAKAAPDGYTLTFTLPAAVAVNPSLYPKLPYDPLRDFAPVTQLNVIALMIVAHPGMPANSVKELIALAKAKPGHVTFASSGNGSAAHLAMELFKLMAGVDMTHIPYKGGGPALMAAVSGETDMTILGTLVTVPQIKAGNLKALAVLGRKRAAPLPQVPTAAEQGLGNIDVSSWIGLLVPAGTPAPIIARVHQAFTAALKNPAVMARMMEDGNEIVASSPEQFGAFLAQDSARWGKVIRDNNIQVEQ